MTSKNPLIKVLNASGASGIKTFTSILSKTIPKFWTSEGTHGSRMTCSRDWVAEWELFEIVQDENTGKQLLKSRKLKAFASLHEEDGNTLHCDQNGPVVEALFDIDLTFGSIMAPNGLYLTNPLDGGALTATSTVKISHSIFQVQAVTISNVAGNLYAQTVKNPNRIAMLPASPGVTPGLFYIMTDEEGDTYLETGSWEFVDAHDNTPNHPITFAQTPIDTKNYLMKLVPVGDAGNVSFQMSAGHDMFINQATSSDGTAYLYCNAASNTGLLAQFKITAAVG